MPKDEFVNLDELFQNLGSGRNISILSFKSSDALESALRKIKFPFHLMAVYATNGKHYAVINSLRKLKFKEK